MHRSTWAVHPCFVLSMNLSNLATTLLPILKENLLREYPNKQGHVLVTQSDLQAPQARTPLFYGCFDWHSAVHSYASMVRLCRLLPQADWHPETLAFLDKQFSPGAIQAELDHLQRPGTATFEMPYGIAWLLTLCGELRLSKTEPTSKWLQYFEPLETLAAERMLQWLPKLSFPIRTGEHTQTAFSMGLVWDWATTTGHTELRAKISELATTWYGNDKNAPIGYEPSAHDFLSPALCEAALMAKVQTSSDFSTWLDSFLPQLRDTGLGLTPVLPSDRGDGKLVHLDGLNISRAWMLQIILDALPTADPRRSALESCQQSHSDASNECLKHGTYAGTHWLGTFMLFNLSHGA